MRTIYSIEEGLKLRAMPPEEIEAFQLEELRRHLAHAARAPYYKRLFEELFLDPRDIKSTRDISSIPLTDRKTIEKETGLFHAVPSSLFADLSQTSGTTGEALTVPYTREDLKRLAFNEAMAFYGAGMRPGETCLICVTLDRCFVAGLAYFAGVVELGATAMRSGPGQVARQWDLVRTQTPSSVVGVPSLLLSMARWAKEHGIDPSESPVERLVTIGEPVRKNDLSPSPLGRDLAELWSAMVISSYAATELQTCFCECREQAGGHVHPELAIVEIVDEAGEPLPPGVPGEVVVTPLGVEGMPLVRYRTGDVARLHTGPCPCGWNTPRLGPIEGRLSQRLKFRGTTFYPDAVFQALQEDKRIKAAYVEVRSSYDLSDDVTVVVGADQREIGVEEIRLLLQARLRVKPEVVIRPVEEVLNTMTASGGRKPKKFFDFRQEGANSNRSR